MAKHLHSSRENDVEKSDREVVAATFKVLVLGNSSVGKSSLIKRYSTSEKPGSMMPTIGNIDVACYYRYLYSVSATSKHSLSGGI